VLFSAKQKNSFLTVPEKLLSV